MAATDSAMAGPGGTANAGSGDGGAKMTSGWASPTTLGLLVFGGMTILFGLMFLPGPWGNPFAGSYANTPGQGYIFLGGSAFLAYATAAILAIVGLIALFEGHHFWGTAFVGYAGFWASWGYASHHAGFLGFGVAWAAFFFVWTLFTLTFLLGSLKQGWGVFVGFLVLFIGMALLTALYWQLGAQTNLAGATAWSKISAGQKWATGGVLILTGFLWWYGGTAQIVHKVYGKKYLPM